MRDYGMTNLFVLVLSQAVLVIELQRKRQAIRFEYEYRRKRLSTSTTHSPSRTLIQSVFMMDVFGDPRHVHELGFNDGIGLNERADDSVGRSDCAAYSV